MTYPTFSLLLFLSSPISPCIPWPQPVCAPHFSSAHIPKHQSSTYTTITPIIALALSRSPDLSSPPSLSILPSFFPSFFLSLAPFFPFILPSLALAFMLSCSPYFYPAQRLLEKTSIDTIAINPVPIFIQRSWEKGAPRTYLRIYLPICFGH